MLATEREGELLHHGGRGAGRSGGRRNDRNTSGQRGNNFNNSYRDISVVVAENNSVCKAKMLTVYFAK